MSGEDTERQTWSRRKLLQGGAIAASFSFAGCVGTLTGGGSKADPGSFESPPPELEEQAKGPDSASVEVYVYTDYECSHCHDFEVEVMPEIQDLLSRDDVRFVHRDFPIPVKKPWSWRLPNLPRSGQAQKDLDTYWSLQRYIWQNWDQSFDEDFVRTAAEEHGLDANRTWRATQEKRYDVYVEADRELGEMHGVTGTPGILVDGDLLDGYSEGTVRSAIESRL
jgi:hypothetical protein